MEKRVIESPQVHTITLSGVSCLESCGVKEVFLEFKKCILKRVVGG